MEEQNILAFQSDYMEGAHPSIIKRLEETNMLHTAGYGSDEYTEEARSLIRGACVTPIAEIQFLPGGTQANATVIDCLLQNWQGVIAADTAHIAVHEAGAIEHAGHKVITLKGKDGKISAEQVEKYLRDFYADSNWQHMVEPGMVYISQPTEYGTLYSHKELRALSDLCEEHKLSFYIDGARLAYAFGSPENEVTLNHFASYSDVFCIGGTKCGALFGEAVVVPIPQHLPHFFTQMKQRGAVIAKGRLLGLQFAELFRDGLYFEIGKKADEYAQQIQSALEEAGYKIYIRSQTNQVFFVIPDEKLESLSKKVMYGYMEKYDEKNSVIRFCTSWATTQKDVDALLKIIKEM